LPHVLFRVHFEKLAPAAAFDPPRRKQAMEECLADAPVVCFHYFEQEQPLRTASVQLTPPRLNIVRSSETDFENIRVAFSEYVDRHISLLHLKNKKTPRVSGVR
jgi:hypothetical protein